MRLVLGQLFLVEGEAAQSLDVRVHGLLDLVRLERTVAYLLLLGDPLTTLRVREILQDLVRLLREF